MLNLKKTTFLIIFSSFLIFSFQCFAQEDQETYYLLYLTYNVPSYSIQLKENNILGEPSLSLTKYNFTQDTGSGSQFYAQVLDTKGKSEIFNSNSDRFYLGQWQARMFWDGPNGGGSKELDETEVQISVPYFPDGQKINIYRADNNQLALSVDVSRFAVNLDDLTVKDTDNKTPQTQDGSTSQALLKSQNMYLWILIGSLIIIAVAFGIWIWKRKKEEI